MDHQSGAEDLAELRNEIVIAEALSYGLLYSPDDTERREVAGIFGVRKISGNVQLEVSLSPCVGVGIAEPGLC